MHEHGAATGGALAAARPPPPPPADPPPFTDGNVTDAWLHGMHVLVKRVPGAEATTTQLYVLGGARTWAKSEAGLEELAICVSLEGGTERMNRDQYTQRITQLGSAIGGHASSDFSVFSSWSLTPAWDETFAMLADAFLHPALPAAQLEIDRARQLSWLAHEQERPDERLSFEVWNGVYRGHPYEIRANGTPETVRTLTAAQVSEHLASLRQTSRLLLVVVGDVEPAHVISVVTEAFADLPRGGPLPTAVPPLPTPISGKVTVVADKLPTTYVDAVAPGPTWYDPDFPVAIVAMGVLRPREFQEVRTKRNLSYAPSTFYWTDLEVPLVGLYVTAVDPGSTLKVMLDEARKLREQRVPEQELLSAKSTVITNLFLEGEAPDEQAWQLARAQIHGGDWHLVRTLPDRIRAVTPAQIQIWASKNLTHLQTFVLGDDRTLDKGLLESF
jgi:zinc protease